MILPRMAWRNVWRNPRRTLITVFAMAFGLTMMIVSAALMEGMLNQMVRYATVLGSGHVQVHHPEYLEDRSLYDSMADPAAVVTRIETAVAGDAAPRAFATALVSSGGQSAGALLWGVDPEREGRVTNLPRHLEAGRFLDPASRGGVVLGTNLARTLGLDPGGEAIILTQAADGSLGNAVFRVDGVLASVGEGMDRGGVMMDLRDLDELLSLQGRVHEVAVRLKHPDSLEEETTAIRKALEPDGLEVKNWKALMPELEEYLRLSRTSILIVLVIIFAVASLGIVNTQLMALFERTREIGVLRALGMRPWAVAALVLLETFFLTVLAAAAGALAGSLWAARLERAGWDMSSIGGGFSFLGVTFDPHLYAATSARSVLESVAVMLVIAFFATLYPVFRAARITPADAIGRGR